MTETALKRKRRPETGPAVTEASDWPVVELLDAAYTYPSKRKHPYRTVGPISLGVTPGERVALIGRNGSGKSTLINLLSTASAAKSGVVRWFGSTDVRVARRRLGVVFQSPALDAMLTIGETLSISAQLLHLPRESIKPRTSELAELLGFADRLDDRIGTLSGGFARRVDLARAIVHAPELLLLDEATAGLDDASAAAFNAMLDRLTGDGVTIIAATHAVDEISLARRVVTMDAGMVVADRSVRVGDAEAEPKGLRMTALSDATAEYLRSLGLHVSSTGKARVEMNAIPDESLGQLVRTVSARGGVLTMGESTMEDYLSRDDEPEPKNEEMQS